MTQLGYARVSTEEQNLDLQLAALSAAGCMQIFTDHGISGTAQERPGLLALLNFAQPGDTLVVWRLDRLGRFLGHLIQLMTDLQHHGVEFQSLNEAIDTRTPTGRFMFHMIAALAEFERALIAERTRAGMSAARQRGRQIGRPRALTPDQVLGVHSSGYCVWQRQSGSARTHEDERLLGLIKHHWLVTGGVYGYRKITVDLRESGETCSRDRVLRLMQIDGLYAEVGYGSKPR